MERFRAVLRFSSRRGSLDGNDMEKRQPALGFKTPIFVLFTAMIFILQERVLPYILRSKLKLASQGVHDEDLLSFIDVSLRGDQDHKDFLQVYAEEYRFQNPYVAFFQKRHCEELALVFILQDDFDRARYYVSECFRSFLEVRCRWTRLQFLRDFCI